MLAPYVDGHLSLLRLPSVEGARCAVLGGIPEFHAQFLRTAGAAEVTVVPPGALIPTGLSLVLAYGVFDGVADPVPGIIGMMGALGIFGTLVVDVELRSGRNEPGSHPHLPWLGDIRRGLADYVLRSWPCGMPGAPGRFMLHICLRRPSIIFIDAPPNSGKSSLSALLAGAGETVRVFSLDMFLHRLQLGQIPGAERLTTVLRDMHARFADLNLSKIEALGQAGLIDEMTELAMAREMDGAQLVIWDGSLPEAYRTACRATFMRQGWVIWGAAPEGAAAPKPMNWLEVMERYDDA